MTNPLTQLPPAVRLWAYIGASVVLLVLGAWQAADGDWFKFIGLVAGALVNLTAASNVKLGDNPNLTGGGTLGTSYGPDGVESHKHRGSARMAVLAVLAALGLMLSSMAPAHATLTNDGKCITIADDGYGTARACISVNYSTPAGGGVYVDAVRIYLAGDMSMLESNALDCDNLRMWNDNSVVKWAKYGNVCDLTKGVPSKTWFPQYLMPGTSLAHFGWSFYPHLNMARDPGYTHLSFAVG